MIQAPHKSHNWLSFTDAHPWDGSQSNWSLLSLEDFTGDNVSTVINADYRDYSFINLKQDNSIIMWTAKTVVWFNWVVPLPIPIFTTLLTVYFSVLPKVIMVVDFYRWSNELNNTVGEQSLCIAMRQTGSLLDSKNRQLGKLLPAIGAAVVGWLTLICSVLTSEAGFTSTTTSSSSTTA